MRAAVAGYVAALHRAYVAQADTFPPAVRGRMPLLAGCAPLTVAAVGARNLHLLATREGLGPLRGQEVALHRRAARPRLDAAVLRPGRRARRSGWLDEREDPRTPRSSHALGVSRPSSTTWSRSPAPG